MSLDAEAERKEASPDHGAAPSRGLEIAIALAIVALSGVAFHLSRSIELRMGAGGIDPRWWPSVLSGSAGLMGLVLLGRALLGAIAPRDDVEREGPGGLRRMLVALGLSCLYVLAWWQIGFLVPTPVYLLALLVLFGVRGAAPLILFPLLTTGFIHLLFQVLLRVPL